MKNEKFIPAHSVFLTEKNSEIKGISAVLGYKDTEITLSLSDRVLIVTGENLTLDSLDTENFSCSISGKVNSLRYKKRGEKTAFLKRLVK